MSNHLMEDAEPGTEPKTDLFVDDVGFGRVVSTWPGHWRIDATLSVDRAERLVRDLQALADETNGRDEAAEEEADEPAEEEADEPAEEPAPE